MPPRRTCQRGSVSSTHSAQSPGEISNPYLTSPSTPPVLPSAQQHARTPSDLHTRSRRGSITVSQPQAQRPYATTAGSASASTTTRSRAGSASVTASLAHSRTYSSHSHSHSHSPSHSRSVSGSSFGFASTRHSLAGARRKRTSDDLEHHDKEREKFILSQSSSLPSPRSPRHGPRWYSSPRALSSPRRILCFMLCGIFGLTVLAILRDPNDGSALAQGVSGISGIRWLFGAEPEPEPLCRFVSPVEAYRHDLTRLRALYPASASNSSTHGSKYTHHTFSPTGHLVMSDDPTAPHPIPQLLALGEKRWEELLARQSRTLSEAVNEYKRRYKRNPPAGFDMWWQLAVERELVLPDEYDRINLDLAPFWALPKHEMQKRLQWVEDMPEVFILDVKKGRVKIEIKDNGGLMWRGTKPRANDIASLIRTFARYLPDFRATFSIFDQPQIYLSWARRESLVDLGLHGKHTTHLVEEDNADVRLSRSCPPTSNFRRNPHMREGKSFVYDMLQASDFCENPYLVPLHGLTIEPHTRESHPRPHTQLLPLFSLTKTVINSDILITPLEQFFDTVEKDPPWEKKLDSRLVWRGSPTGISMMTKDIPWRDSHRVRLHRFANNLTGDAYEYIVPDVGEAQANDESDDRPKTLSRRGTPLGYKKETATQAEVFDHMFDIKLAGHPIQCDDADGTCDDMDDEIEWAPHQPAHVMYRHKFVLDIDGNGWSGRFRRLMSSNSLVIKTGLFTEWYQPHLVPWFMYVPAQLDFSDLADIMSFFAGSPKHPELAFDETAKALAANGQCFVERMFRYDDLQAYMFRLFLEYTRLAAPEGEDADFHYDPAEHGDPAMGGDGGEEGDGDDADEDEEDEPAAEKEKEKHPSHAVDADRHAADSYRADLDSGSDSDSDSDSDSHAAADWLVVQYPPPSNEDDSVLAPALALAHGAGRLSPLDPDYESDPDRDPGSDAAPAAADNGSDSARDSATTTAAEGEAETGLGLEAEGESESEREPDAPLDSAPSDTHEYDHASHAQDLDLDPEQDQDQDVQHHLYNPDSEDSDSESDSDSPALVLESESEPGMGSEDTAHTAHAGSRPGGGSAESLAPPGHDATQEVDEVEVAAGSGSHSRDSDGDGSDDDDVENDSDGDGDNYIDDSAADAEDGIVQLVAAARAGGNDFAAY